MAFDANRNKCRVAVLIALPMLLFSGCANPTFTETKSTFVPKDWRAVAILPFNGDKRFTAVATDAFSARLLNVGKLKLVQPSETEVVVRKLGMVSRESELTVVEAQRVATEINADGVVTSHHTGTMLNGFCTAKIIDAKTGEVVAVSHHPSGLLFGNSEHHAVIAATERTSKEMAKVLLELERKNQVSRKISNQGQTL